MPILSTPLTWLAIGAMALAAPAPGGAQEAGTPMHISVPLQAEGWQALPDQVRPGELPRMVREYRGPEAALPEGEPYGVAQAEDGVEFRITSNDPPYALRTMVWTRPLPPDDLTRCTYFLLTYRAEGIARSHAPLSAVSVVGPDSGGKEMTSPLLPVAEIINDDLWHTVVGKASPPRGGALRVQVGTTDSGCALRLRALQLLEALPALGTSSLVTPPFSEPPGDVTWERVDLSGLYNDTCAAAFARLLERQGVVIDGANALDSELLCQIPFLCGGADANLVSPVETKADDEPIEFLGVKTTRHYVRPPGRDDVVAVDLRNRASEALFLMVSEVPKGGGRYALAPGPHSYSDIGALSVELQYETGEPSVAFPYSLADAGFTATRMAGVYAMAADPDRVLKRFVIHNRVNGQSHSLAALTLNAGPGRLVPSLAQEPEPLRVHRPAAARPQRHYLRRDGQLLRLGNNVCDLVVDCGSGFSITELRNRFVPRKLSSEATVGLEVRCGDALLRHGAFATRSIAVAVGEATVELESRFPEVPLALTVRIAIDARPEVRLQLSARNTGDRELSPRIRFPSIEGVCIGAPEDTWLFFPQYRAVLSNGPGSYLVGNDRSFPLQFMDIFSPAAGAGLGLLTRDTQLTPLEYGMFKQDTGAGAFVQSTAAFSKLAPGQTLTMPETVLLAHAGDWHTTMAAYKDWLARVDAAPSPAPQREWFRTLFALRSHLTKKAYSWAIPIYDPTTQQYKVDEFVQADTDYLGMSPQVVHLGGWCDFDHEHGGDFLGGDYAPKDYTGGADNLRAAIRKLQDEHHTAVSLYMIPDRCRITSEIGRALGRKVCQVREDGWVGEDGPLYYVCPAYRPWQDHYVEAVRRTQRELGVKAIYVDVFGFSRGTACYSREHGHPVPSNPKRATRDLIGRIREALPPDVAVWTEFPIDDVSARYSDGNIHYYCLNWHEYFSETHDAPETAPLLAGPALNTYRYVFPHVRQFIFLCGSENWSGECKFPFFNGEPLYDVSWFLYAGPNLALIRNALALQTAYADCFSSAAPAMEVPTERWGVHANAFPGEDRTAWTLYNARYTTVDGTVLRVPHVAGATYVDAWNHRPLDPFITGTTATIALRLEPQALGCVVQQRKR